MTAKVTRLAPPAPYVDIATHLRGSVRRQTGMMEQMMGRDAVRRFVMSIASRHPLGDSRNHDDVWAQVEDVCAEVATLTANTVELENYVHALRRVISASTGQHLATTEADLMAGCVRIRAYGRRMRVTVVNDDGCRTIDFRLERDGAVRIGDHATAR